MTETVGRYTLEQPEGVLKLGTDTLALSGFVTLKPRDRVCDLGCGNGALSLLLLSRRDDIDVTALDIRDECVCAARANMERNKLSERMRVVQGDWRDALRDAAPFDVTASNPPYYRRGDGAMSPDAGRIAARSWEDGGPDVLCAAVLRLTRYGGRFAAVYPAPLLADMIAALRTHDMEPKRLRFVHHHEGKDASLVLLEARRGGRPGLRVEPALYLSREGSSGE